MLNVKGRYQKQTYFLKYNTIALLKNSKNISTKTYDYKE